MTNRGHDQMRCDQLFADLEAQADALALSERGAEADERARIELARVQLVDRLAPAIGGVVRVRCPCEVSVGGTLTRVGAGWVLIDEPARRQALVALGAVVSVSGLGRLTAPAHSLGIVASRLGFGYALREVARDRSAVRIDLIDGASLDGTIDRVGADFIELAVHAAGEARRRGDVREVLIVALGAVAVVRRDGD